MPQHVSAVIMAGGEGRRMARTRSAVPKPLVNLGGIPLIEITIRQLLAAGIQDIHVALHHRADEIMDHLKQSRLSDLTAINFIVEPRPLGTIGALAELKDLGRTVLTANGDLLSGIDLRALLAFHRRERADMTIPTHTERVHLKLGEVFSDSGSRVTGYVEKPVKQYRISSGIYCIEPRLIALLERGEVLPFPGLVQRALAAGMKIMEHHHREPWLDINDEDDLITGYAMVAGDPAAFGLGPDELGVFEDPPG